ncbi:hypothetical protein P154DRAFT_527591 [Amniculicola lignicola CBS 123094]|uniref:DUF3533 domain-containing protein n=1 Tax=Amniculicola lignicola CBS 123094 TaxID=1392246 RepID=A0A6A5W0I0_9PLEO|nr:hypothetical protein P154DRAFT_527591 [Amniculicola lignicola CBS 123094]
MVNLGLGCLRRFREKPTLTNTNRTPFYDESWKGIRTKFILQTTAGGVAFMLWFLACCCYMYGTLHGSTGRHAAVHVLAVDYDGGAVGEALQAAYQKLRGPGMVTLRFHTAEDYPTEEDMYRAVWEGKYWAAIAATEGASDRLAAALQGGEASESYNPADALHYIWNQQYYTTFANMVVQSGVSQLVVGSRVAFDKINGTQATLQTNTSDPAAIQALLNPILATARNIKVAAFGDVILLNTISIAIPIMIQFFFLLVLNGTSLQHQLYNKMTIRSSLLARRVAGLLFTLGAALCQTGYFWAFKEDWEVNGNQFAMTWMLYWLLMHIHLLILDSISTIAPLPVMPFVLLFWVFLNIASTLSPLELQPGFYHWSVALPSLNAYSILMTIWSGGAHNRLYRAFPILFSWWVVANITTSITHWRAAHLAYKMEHDQETAQKKANDEEAAVEVEGGTESSLSRKPTLFRLQMGLERQRTVEQAALEQRKVYGPSIPPLA